MSLQFNNQKPDNEQVTHYPKATSTPANKTVGVEGFTPKAQTVQKTNGGYNVADSNGLSFKSTIGKSAKAGSYSIGEMCGIIYDSFSKGNKDEANKAFNALVSLQRDPNSKYYNAYAGATNSAVLGKLSELTGRDYSNGISTQEINDLWNQFGSQYVATNTGGISSSTKNSAGAQIAYYVNQLATDEKTTQAAEGELAKKMAEVQYYVDRGYSDDWIRKNVNFDDCSTIKKAIENANTAGMLPTQFNRSIGIYGEDTINGMLYSARRGNGTYSGMSDIMMYYGAGSGYKADKNSEAARDKTNPEAYHPYSFGASDTKNMNTICRNYGIAAFDREWLDANEASLIENGDYAHALAAVENYEAATKEVELLDKYADVRIASAIEKGENITPEQVMAVAFDANPKDFPTLVKMDEKRKKGEALEVSDTVDFTRTYYLQKIEQKIEQAKQEKEKADTNQLLATIGIDPESAGKKANEIDEATAKSNIVGSTAYSLIASSMNSDGISETSAKDMLKYIEENGLERKEGMTDEEYLESLNTYAEGRYKAAQDKAAQEAKEEAFKVQPTQNFSMSGFYEEDRDDNDTIDELGYIKDAIVLGLQGKEDMIADPNGKAWWMKYSGTLTAGTERDTKSVMAGLSGRALTHDRLTEAFGENVASKLYAVDDAARDGYISMDERADYLMQMSTLVDKYGESGIEAVYNGQAGSEEEQAQVRQIVDAFDDTIVQNKEQAEIKAHAEKQTNAAYYGLLLQDEREANTETGRAMLEALESVNLSEVDDDSYTDALTNLNDYVNSYLSNEAEDMLIDGSTNAINAPIYYNAALDINNIMRVGVAVGLDFDEALVSMGYDSIDALIADSTERVFNAYQTTYNDLAGVVDAFIGSFSDKEMYATVDTGTSPEKWNARWQDMLNQIAEDEVVSEEQLARFEEFYNSLDGSEQRALREEMLDRQRGSEDTSQFNYYLARMANESAEEAYNNSIGNVDVASTAKGVTGDAEGGFFDALGRGVSAGYVQHKMGLGDIIKATMARDTESLEAEYRNTYTRPQALEQYQKAIDRIEDPGYRQLMQQQLDSYTGDAYDFKFDINTVAIENYRRRQEEKLRLMNKEALEVLTPAEYNVYSSMQTVTNSALISLETVGAVSLMTAAGMPEGTAVLLANIAVTGAFEGAPVTLDLIEKGVSSDEATLFGAMAGASAGTIEALLDTGLEWFGVKTGMSRYIDGALGINVGATSNYWASGLMGKMLKSGVNKNVASFASTAAKFGNEYMLNGLTNTFKGLATESIEEGLQEFSSQLFTGLGSAVGGVGNFWDSFDIDPVMDVMWETFKNTPYQSIAGGLFGGVTGSIVRGATNNTVGRATGNYQQSSFKQTLDAMRSVGDWEADFMRAMEADAEARTMYQQNREATNAEVNAEAQAQIDAENAQAQYESDVLDDAYAQWLDEMFANYRIQYEAADMGLTDIQLINEGEAGQAVRDAEAAETEAKENVTQAEDAVQNAEKIMNDAEQEMMAQDIPSADSIKLYKESQTAFSSALDALTNAQETLAQRTAEVKAAVANRTKLFSAAMENARQVAKANVEKTIADIKAAREQLRQKNVQAIKEAAQREISTRDERIGTMNVAETETNLRSKFSENSGAQWFIDMAKMLAENTGKNIFDNYVENETKAKLAIADIIQTSFPGWTVKVEQLEGGSANINKSTNTITFNSDATIQQWFTGIIAHELVHMAEGTGKYTNYKQGLIKEFYGDSESDTYKEAVEYIKENYLVEDLKGLTDEQAKRLIEDELVTYTTERLFNQGEFINGGTDTFKVFTDMLLKTGQTEFGRDIYNILLNQAVAIKQVNAKNGWFKTRLKTEQVKYAKLVESLADMIKSVSDDTKAKALEAPKSAAELLFDQTENEAAEQNPIADAESYKEAVGKGEGVAFDESIKPNLPVFGVNENGEYSLSDEAIKNLDADEKAIVEAAIESHTEDEYNAALAGDMENVAQTVEDDVRRETLNAIRDGILGDGLTEDDLANIQMMVDDGLLLQSDVDLIKKWADGKVAAIPTRAPKVEAPKTDYDLYERTNLTDENGKKINLGSKVISPYYNTHWDEFLYAREAAEILLDDMSDYAAPESYAFEGGVGENYTEVRRVNGSTTSLISDLLTHFKSVKGKGRSADQVKAALAEFIKAYDTSTPLRNTAAMKWIELAVDDILRNGYKTIRGEEHSANQDYINMQNGNTKSNIENQADTTDTEYIKAVESGDTETQNRLVDEAAKKAGYTEVVYHGTTAEFNSIELERTGQNYEGEAAYGKGFYTSNDENVARAYAFSTNPANHKVLNLYLKRGNSVDVEDTISNALYIEMRKRGLNVSKNINYEDAIYAFDTYDEARDAFLTVGIDTLESFDPGVSAGMDRRYKLATLKDGANQLVSLNPEYVKSAAPVTYDENGNVIPLSERFNNTKNDLRYSRSSFNNPLYGNSHYSLDAKYAAADDATKREMLDKEAADAGYTYKGYHGTNSEFYTFDISKSSSMNDMGKGFYFSTNQIDGESYSKSDGDNQDVVNKATSYAYDKAYETGYDEDSSEFTEAFNDAYDEFVNNYKENGRTIGAYLKLNNPFIVSDDNYITVEEAHDIISKADTYTKSDLISAVNREAKNGLVKTSLLLNSNDGSKLADVIRNGKKYDGIIDKTVSDKFNLDKNTDHIIVFDSSQIKSADLDTGVPLSQRFDDTNPNIRYSSSFGNIRSRLGNIFTNMYNSLAREAIESGDSTTYRRMMGRMYGSLARYKTNSNTKVGTPLNTVRMLANDLGSHIFDKVRMDTVTTIGADSDGSFIATNEKIRSTYDTWSNAISTDAVSGKNLSAVMGSIAEVVMKRLNEAGLINNTDQQTAEEFAEWFFHFMTHGDANLGNAASMYAQTFRDAVNDSNDENLKAMWNAILNRRQQLCKYIYGTNAMKIQSYMVSKENRRKNPHNNWHDNIRNFLTYTVDRSLTATLVDEQTGGHALQNAVLYSPYMLRRAERVLNGKRFVDADGHDTGFDTLSIAIEKSGMKPSRENYAEFNRYLMAMAAIDRASNGMPAFNTEDDTGIFEFAPTEQNLRDYVAEIQASRDDIAKAAEGFWEFNRNFMQTYVVDEGLLDSATWEEWKAKTPHYASLKRYMGDLEKNASTATGNPLGVTFHKYVGNSNREVINPVESMVDMVHSVVNAVSSNRIKQVFSEQYENNQNLGYIAERVEADKVNIHDPDVIAVHFHDKVGDFTETRYYKIANKELFNLLAGVNEKFAVEGFAAVGKVTRAMTMLTTGVNPLFALKNAARDFQHSVNYGSWASTYLDGFFKWVSSAYDIGREMFAGKGSQQAKDYIDLGGGEWERMGTNGRKGVRQVRREIFGRNTTETIGHKIYEYSTFAGFNALIETASRYAEYKYGKNDVGTDNWISKLSNGVRGITGQTQSNGVATDDTKRTAFMAAQEATVDFQRSGNGLRILKKCVPFFNATMQGNYQDVRLVSTALKSGAEGNKARKTLFKTFMNHAITGAMIAALNLFVVGDDDDKEEYMNVDEGIKTDYMLIPMRKLLGEELGNKVFGGRDALRIPVSAGMIEHMFYNFGRSVVEDAYSGKEVTGFGRDIGRIAVDSVWNGFSEFTTIISPLWQVSKNKAWYGDQLVSSRTLDDNKQDSSLWANASSSGLSIKLARLLQGYLGNSMYASPIGIDYLLQQYTGIIGQMLMPMMSPNKYTGESITNPEKATGVGVLDSIWYVMRNMGNTALKSYTIDTDASSQIDDTFETFSERLENIITEGKNGTSISTWIKPGMSDRQYTQMYEDAVELTSKDGIIGKANDYIKEQWSYWRATMNGEKVTVEDADGNKVTIDYSQRTLKEREIAAEEYYDNIRKKQLEIVPVIGDFEEKYLAEHPKTNTLMDFLGMTDYPDRINPLTNTERKVSSLSFTAQQDSDNDERYMVFAEQMYDAKPSDTVMPSPAYEWTSNKVKYTISDAYKEQYDEDFMLRYKELAEQYLVKYDAGAFADEEEAREEWAKVRTGANEYARKMWNLNGNP